MNMLLKTVEIKSELYKYLVNRNTLITALNEYLTDSAIGSIEKVELHEELEKLGLLDLI